MQTEIEEMLPPKLTKNQILTTFLACKVIQKHLHLQTHISVLWHKRAVAWIKRHKIARWDV